MEDSVKISSPGLAPSNRGSVFPNLARAGMLRPELEEEVSAVCRAELEAAGIRPHDMGFAQAGEVPSRFVGAFGPWSFRRAWYYWMASGPGIPVELAEALHAAHGQVVRVAGHCGCPSPREWYKGFGVGDYHVDTPAGLKALADALRTIHDPSAEPGP